MFAYQFEDVSQPQPQRPGHAAGGDPMPPPGLALIFACIFRIFSPQLSQLPQLPQMPQL